MLIKGLSFLLLAALIISPAFISRTAAQTTDGRQSVVWTSVVNCSVAGSSLQKTAGRDDTADAGARSEQTIMTGNAFVEFTAIDPTKTVFCGFSRTAIGTDYVGIDFAVKLTDYSVAEVRENNIYKAETTYRAGDVFRVSVDSGLIRYFKNGGLFYTSFRTPTYPLIVQAAFMQVGARLENAAIGTSSGNAPAEWRMYQHDAGHSGFATTSRVGADNASTLGEAWSFQTGDWVTGTPVVGNGLVYVGSWDGRMYALRESDGSPVWSFATETITLDSCSETYGIDSTAALVDGRLYFGTSTCTIYSLDAATGNEVWRTRVADPQQAFHLWSSPLVFDGKIYIGLASHCVNPCVRGRVVCLSAATGQVLWTFNTAPEGSTGAAVWSSLAIDSGRRMVYVTTGNYCTGEDTYGDSILALNSDTGLLIWQYKNSARDRDRENLDFGASPVLFDTEGVPALAVGSKDGFVYAVRRETGELLWTSRVTDASSIGGIISSPAAAYGKIFMGATVNSQTGKVVALDQRDGQILWEAPQPAGVLGAAAVSGGAVFIGGVDGTIRAYDVDDGTLLWSTKRGSIYGGVSITQDRLFVGSADNSIYAFALDATRPNQPPQSQSAITVDSPAAAEEWRKGTKYDVRWSIVGPISTVDVSISRDGGNTFQVIAEDVDASLGVFRVKAKKPRSDSVIVKVSDSSDPAISGRSGVFRIR
jgi:polyvinyl alcohol dehydrogenase (cytochrome)